MAKGFDTRRLATGKDGKLYITLNKKSYWYANVEEFEITANFSNTDYQPAGDYQQYGVPTSVKFTLKFTEAVIRDDLFLVPVIKAIKSGKAYTTDFVGTLTEPFGGRNEKISCKECIPDGEMGLMNVKPGEVVKRSNSFIINSVPDILKALSA